MCNIKQTVLYVYVHTEVGIFRRKQKKSDLEKKKVFFFFSWSRACFLSFFLFSLFFVRFLGRVLVFLLSYFLVFFYKFPTQGVLFHLSDQLLFPESAVRTRYGTPCMTAVTGHFHIVNQ